MEFSFFALQSEATAFARALRRQTKGEPVYPAAKGGLAGTRRPLVHDALSTTVCRVQSARPNPVATRRPRMPRSLAPGPERPLPRPPWPQATAPTVMHRGPGRWSCLADGNCRGHRFFEQEARAVNPARASRRIATTQAQRKSLHPFDGSPTSSSCRTSLTNASRQAENWSSTCSIGSAVERLRFIT